MSNNDLRWYNVRKDAEDAAWKAQLMLDLKRDEGFSSTPYTDGEQWLTIGYGRWLGIRMTVQIPPNQGQGGITEAEAFLLLQNDVEKAVNSAHEVKGFARLSAARKRVVTNMIFNLGFTRFLKFHKFLAALANEDWNTAAKEMLDSKWARQVGPRAERLAALMRMG